MRHPWVYHRGFNEPKAEIDGSGNKIYMNLGVGLPSLGEPQAVWDELCGLSLEGLAEPHLTPEAVALAEKFGAGLARPIIAFAPQGTNSPQDKNLTHECAEQVYRLLLSGTEGTILLCDWDNRVPMWSHGRIRHVKRNLGHLDLRQFFAILHQCALVISVDTGVYHYAPLAGVPALGVFRVYHPSCVSMPRVSAKSAVMARERGAWQEVNIARRQRWNILTYDGEEPTVEEIARHALRMLRPRFGLPAGADGIVQQWVQDFMRPGRTSTSPYADRGHTMDFLLREIDRRFAQPSIVETGCIRVKEGWSSDGNSTYLLGAVAALKGGRFRSVDVDPRHCELARGLCKDWVRPEDVVTAESVSWLGGQRERVDVLYLDSMDVGQSGAGEHNLSEVKAAEKSLHETSLVIVDDTSWNGKWIGLGELAVPYLLENAWRMLASGYQCILSRKGNT